MKHKDVPIILDVTKPGKSQCVSSPFLHNYKITSIGRVGPSQQINLYCNNHEYTEHMHVTSTVGELSS